MKNKKTSLLHSDGVQTLLSSVLCILGGLILGYLVLLMIEPKGALNAIVAVMKSFFRFPGKLALKYFGQTLVRTVPLLMCALSVLFANKAGLFNIGAAGQYVVGAGACLYMALAWNLPWWVCLLGAIAAGAILGALSGFLKTKFNVNEVISCIMFNWISLYCVNMLLATVKESTSPYTLGLKAHSPQSMLPSLGLGEFFSKNQYVTLALPLALAVTIGIWVLLEKTTLGYELKATGNNKNAAKYAGMKENRNIILTMAIAGGLAGMAAALLYLTGYEQWSCSQASVPAMGFNGIAAAFLGGLNPIGSIFSSFFIQHITAGGAYVDKTLYCAQVSDFICSLIIYLCGFVLFMKTAMNRSLDKADEKRKAKKLEGGKK